MHDSLAGLNAPGKKKAEEPRRAGRGFSLSLSLLGLRPQPTREEETGGRGEVEETRREGSDGLHHDLGRNKAQFKPNPNQPAQTAAYKYLLTRSSSSSSRTEEETLDLLLLSMPPSSALGKRDGGDGFLAALSRSQVAAHGREAATMAKKLLRSTGKAAWIAGTTFLVLVVPLIIEMDREQQLNDLELQQQTLLGGPPPPPPIK